MGAESFDEQLLDVVDELLGCDDLLLGITVEDVQVQEPGARSLSTMIDPGMRLAVSATSVISRSELVRRSQAITDPAPTARGRNAYQATSTEAMTSE